MSRAARSGAAHRAGDLRPATGAGAVGHRVLGDPPARRPGAQQQLQRVAERRGRRRRGRAAPPGGRPGSARCRAPARRGGAAAPRSARCRPGRATARPRRPCGTRRPTARSVAPDATAAAIAGSTAGVQRAVAVEHGDQLGAGRLQAGVDGGAVPAARLGDHPGAVGRGRPRRWRRWTRCRRRAPASRRAALASTAGSASASSRHGRMISGSTSTPDPRAAGAPRGRLLGRLPFGDVRSGVRAGPSAQSVGGEGAHPVGEPDRRPEAEQRTGPRRVGDDVPDVAGPGAADDHRRRGRRIAAASAAGQVADRVRLAGADVDRGRARPGRVRRRGRARWPRPRR